MELLDSARKWYWALVLRLVPQEPTLEQQLFTIYRIGLGALIGCTVVLLGVALWTASVAGAAGIVMLIVGILCCSVLGAVDLVVVGLIHQSAVVPLRELLGEIQGGGKGYPASPARTPGELQQLRSAMEMLAKRAEGTRAREVAEAQEGKSRDTTLRYILRYASDVGGSLNAGTITAALSDIAMAIGGYRYAQVWQVNELDNSLKLAHSTVPAKLAQALSLKSSKEGRAAIERALGAAHAIPYRLSDGKTQGVAVPMVHGLSMLGAIELIEQTNLPTVEDPIAALELLAQYAATDLVAARLHQEVEARSETDGLTRIFNRRKLDVDLRSEVARSVRYGHPLSILMIDVDHFKKFNDTYGHQLGDEVLKTVAATLQESSRETDSAYRFGGEEFVLVLRETEIDAARDAAERFRLKVEKVAESAHLPSQVTVSIGVSAVGEETSSIDSLIEAADEALYQAKEHGRNQVIVNQRVTKQ